MDGPRGQTITLGQLSVRFLVEPSESNETASVFECDVPTNSTMPVPHSHDAFEETIYGLKGALTLTVDGQTTEIVPGAAVCIQRGAVHGFENRGDTDAAFLAISTPGLMTPDYFREIADVLGASAAGPPDRAAMMDVMLRHGLTPAAPSRS